MAIEVSIKSNRLFKKNLKAEEFIFDDVRFGIMDDAYRLDEGKIGNGTVIFPKHHVCRGFEMYIDKDEIHLRLSIPTSEIDIDFFYDYVKRICDKVRAKDFVREGVLSSFKSIKSFKEEDLALSKQTLENMEEDILSGKYVHMYIFGAVNPISIGTEELKKIDKDVKKFGEFMDEIQSRDLYYASANIYKKGDDSLFGVYVLATGVTSVFPLEAKLLMAREDIKISEWYMSFVLDDEHAGEIPYEKFLDSVDKSKKYDDDHFIVELDKEEMEKLLDLYRVGL